MVLVGLGKLRKGIKVTEHKRFFQTAFGFECHVTIFHNGIW